MNLDRARALSGAMSLLAGGDAWAKEDQETLDSMIAEIEKLAEIHRDSCKIIHNLVCANQAAWIEWQHGKGAEAAMGWIHNGLIGPGHIPDEDAPYGKEAQAYYDANCADPLPQCFCGRPSSILYMGKGYCCDEHFKQGGAGE